MLRGRGGRAQPQARLRLARGLASRDARLCVVRRPSVAVCLSPGVASWSAAIHVVRMRRDGAERRADQTWDLPTRPGRHRC